MTVRQAKTIRFTGPSAQHLVVFFGLVMMTSSAQAITVYQIDDFQDESLQGWQGAIGDVLMDVGPGGVGDHSLLVSTTGFPGGVNSRLITYHGGAATPVTTQWTGDWSAAGVRRIAFEVLNPNSFPLTIWLGIAGPAGPGGAGSNDAHVTRTSVAVPPDEQWHTVEFRVLADDFDTWGAIGTPAAALADVFQFRILHSPEQEWRGALGEASMLIDNIRTIPEPSAGVLACAAIAAPWRARRRRLDHRGVRSGTTRP